MEPPRACRFGIVHLLWTYFAEEVGAERRVHRAGRGLYTAFDLLLAVILVGLGWCYSRIHRTGSILGPVKSRIGISCDG